MGFLFGLIVGLVVGVLGGYTFQPALAKLFGKANA